MKEGEVVAFLVSDLKPVRRGGSVFLRLLLWSGLCVIWVAVAASFGRLENAGGDFFRVDVVALFMSSLTAGLAALFLSVPGEDASIPAGFAVASFAISLGSLFVMYLAGDALAQAPIGSSHEFRCAWSVVKYSLVPALMLLGLVRLGAPLESRKSGFFLLFGAGALGAVATELACPYTSASHILISHVLPASILGGLGVAVGKVLLCWDRLVRSVKAELIRASGETGSWLGGGNPP